MLNNSEKKSILKRILQSDAFVNSQVYQKLLAYLVEASINNKTPKEYDIATDVLHKTPDFDPSQDTIVRVHIYNLRKKLDHYYSHEGSEEEFRIELPKGHYEINFVDFKKSKIKTGTPRYYWLVPIVLLILSNLFFLVKYFSAKETPKSVNCCLASPIWKDFLTSGLAKQIVLGDHFFFIKDSDNREKRTILRRDDINTWDEFSVYKAAQIERRNYIKLRYPMFPRNSVWPFADIVNLFSKTDQNFSLNYSSNVTGNDFKNNDMLFIGSLHTLTNLSQIFRNSNFKYQIYPNVVSYYDEINDTLITCPEVGDPVTYHIDYGIVRKIPGPTNNIIFIFTSFHETGTIGIIKYFMNQATLQELEQKFMQKMGHVPPFYEILFKASGYNRTDYTTEIVYLTEIGPDIKLW